LKKDIQTIAQIKKLNSSNLSIYPNVYILDNNTVYLSKLDNTVTYRIPDPQFIHNYVQIIGSTLWSRVTEKAYILMNDYKHIYTDMNKNISRQEYLKMFRDSVEYIQHKLLIKCDTILATHHGIHDICNGKYQGNNLCSGFATFIPEFFENENLKIAINGHTHINMSNTIKDVRLVSNCFGYNNQEREGFDECRIIEIN
jgi:hypothetical protein